MTDKLKVKIFNEVYELNHKEEIKIAEETVNGDLIRQPAHCSFYGVLCALAEDEVRKANLHFRILEAQMDSDIRKDLIARGEKKLEKQIQSEIILDEDWQAAATWINEAKHAVTTLKAIRKGFDDRMNSLISLAANMRKDLGGTDLHINQ